MGKQLNEFYQDKTVLVTGHSGFKGSWLSIWLNELGADVVGFALDPEHENVNFNVAKVGDKIRDVRGDIRDFNLISSCIQEHEPDIIFHLAAQALVGRSYEEPLETYQTNVLGTANVLESARRCDSVQAVVNITSDKVYRNKDYVWGYREEDELGGCDPYSSSKACAEHVTAAYKASFFAINEGQPVGICTTRAGNVIGGGDWAEKRLLPDCVEALQKDETIQIRSPKAVRPWQHVLEPLYGYLLLGKRLSVYPSGYSTPWNFAPPKESTVTVEELVEMIVDVWGSGEWMDVSSQESFEEAQLLRLDNSKARYELGWKPMLSLREAVEMAISGYQAKGHVYENRVNQIGQYIGLLKND